MKCNANISIDKLINENNVFKAEIQHLVYELSKLIEIKDIHFKYLLDSQEDIKKIIEIEKIRESGTDDEEE